MVLMNIGGFNLREQIVGNHNAVALAVDGYMSAGLIFEKIWIDDSTGINHTKLLFSWDLMTVR